MEETKKQLFTRGMKDGIPIGLGYFAVSFTLGIAAKNAGMTALQAAVTSALINASAGEFIGFTLIAANAGYLEVMVMEAVANARYLLMSCALSQKISSDTGLLHRLLMGFYVTDEIFGVSIAQKELKPIYSYGVISMAAPGWTLGTFLGVRLHVTSILVSGTYYVMVSNFSNLDKGYRRRMQKHGEQPMTHSPTS